MFYQGRSYYNALELQLAKRMSHGFQVQGTYTWGKSMDTSSATLPAMHSAIRFPV